MPTSVGYREDGLAPPVGIAALRAAWLRGVFAMPRALAVAASVAAALIALSIVDSAQLYRDARQQAEADATMLARLLAERSRGALGEVRTVMNAAAQGLRQRAFTGTGPVARSLADLRALEPSLIGLTVFDMDSRELAASRDFHAPPPDAPDRATLTQLAAARGPDRGWGYGHVSGSAANVGWFSMVRLVLADDGTPLGAVVAQVEREQLRSALDGIELRGMTVLLALRQREGGEVLALRTNVDESQVRAMLALEPALKAVAHGNRSGWLDAHLADDDRSEWLVGYELLERKDLVAVAWVDDHPALAAARRGWAVKIARVVCAVALTVFIWTVGARRARRIDLAASDGADTAAADLLDATESAQRALALELHDGVCQQLTGARYLADACERRLREQGSAQADDVRNLASLITASIDQTRAVVRGLQPVGDGSHGLAHALDDLCARTRATFDIDCRYIDRASGADFDAATASQAFRIAQEAVNNARRHGKARRIEVRSGWEDGRYALEVWSDGAVPDLDALAAGRGRGIPGMRLRAAHLGAELSFEHAPDDAFCVQLRLDRAAAPA